MIYCGKAEFGRISRSFSLNSGAIRLKRPKNLTQIGFFSLRSVKPDRLLAGPDGEYKKPARDIAVLFKPCFSRSPIPVR